MTERWLPVVGFEGLYEVSDLGRVKSLARVTSQRHQLPERILKLSKDKKGYLVVSLYRGGYRQKKVHHLVLEAFVGPKPPGEECCHLSSVPGDNRLINLIWGTREEQRRDQAIVGTHHEARKTHCIRGHEFTPENTYKMASGGRRCRECQRMWDRARPRRALTRRAP